AFLAYQEFIENYRYNPRFQKALDHQFNIAVKGMNEKTAKFLGINRPLDRSELITMMEQIISNAPQSAYAPYCQYYIGELYDVLGKRPMAVAAYQKVVNEYPRSKLAPKAQLQIGETLGAAVAKGSNDPANLKRTKEAYEDFLTNFPQHADSSLAQQNLTQLNEKDARKSMNVGKFYQKSGNLRAAAIYFKDVLRSTNPALKKEARDQLARIGKKDPEALKQAKISPEATTTPPEERIKSHARYVGPPAPDVASRSTKKSRPTKSVDPAPSTTAKKSTPKPAPAPSTPLVPDLPGSDLLTSDPSLSSDDPFNVDKVVPDSPLDPDSL
ncbi:MAG: outer membrane protein assembly factor BamD, partial [Verrucomicrobiota bacterium]